MGQCPRCGKKQLIGSGLCSNCQSAETMARQKHYIESVRITLPKQFDSMIWTTVNNRFGVSGASEHNRVAIYNLIMELRNEFVFLVNGITTEQYVCGQNYQPKTNKPENVYAPWDRTLCGYDISRSSNFCDGRAKQMNLCANRAIHRVNLYCTAEIAIRAGRFEDAARSYEDLTMYEEAGRIRKMAMQERNTSRNVSVNMNQLIDQVRQGGLALPYKCPNCGGSLKIDKDFAPGIKVCAYCGTPLDTTVIASLMKNM